jgi:hypothetical protein
VTFNINLLVCPTNKLHKNIFLRYYTCMNIMPLEATSLGRVSSVIGRIRMVDRVRFPRVISILTLVLQLTLDPIQCVPRSFIGGKAARASSSSHSYSNLS